MLALQGVGSRARCAEIFRAEFPSYLRRIIALAFFVSAAVLAPSLSSAQTAYDGVYSYDAAGNLQLIEVIAPPTITAIAPAAGRLSSDGSYVIQGGNLGYVTVSTSDPGLVATIQGTTGSTLTLGITILPITALGKQTITVTNDLGSASISITVYPKQPIVSLQPIPFGIDADGKAHAGTLTFSSADSIADTFTLTTSDPAHVTVSPSTVTFAPGQLTAALAITPTTTAAGTVFLQASTPTFLTDDMPILIGASSDGSATAITPVVGVVNPLPTTGPAKTQKVGAVSAPVGVAHGALVTSISPNILYGPGSTSTIVFHGYGLNSSMVPSLALPSANAVLLLSIGPNTSLNSSSVSASADGTTLTWTITEASPGNLITQQPLPTLPVWLVQTDKTTVPFLQPAGGHLLTGLIPLVSSINPIVGAPNSVLPITFFGFNLANLDGSGGSALAYKINADNSLSPSSDIVFDYHGTPNPNKTQLTAQMQVLPTANGKYALFVVTDFGLSGTPGSGLLASTSNATGVQESIRPNPAPAPTPSNQFTVVQQAVGKTSPISSPVVGVVVGSAPVQHEGIGPVATRQVHVLNGSGVISMSPATGIIGTTVPVTVTGSGLSAVTGVSLSPSTGVTVGAPTVIGGGTQMTFNIVIATNAPETARRVDFLAGAVKLPYVVAGGNDFLITPPLPVIQEVTPDYVIKGAAPVQLNLMGSNFQNASAARFSPGAGMSVSAPFNISSDGTRMSLTMAAAASTSSGAQTLTVTTPGGNSSSTMSPSTTVTVGSSAGATYGPIASHLVGVMVGTAPVNHESVGPVHTRLVTVVNPAPLVTKHANQTVISNTVGALNGPGASGISPAGIQKGAASSITVTGVGLNKVTSLTIAPATNVTVSSLTPNANGLSLTATLSVSAAAPSTPITVNLAGSSGKIPFTSRAASEIQVGAMPVISSISPIVATPGALYSMTIRGTNLTDVTAVVASPPSGLEFSDSVVYSTDANGPLLTVQFHVDSGASTGNRTIQLIVPGGSTSATATAANTLSITTGQ